MSVSGVILRSSFRRCTQSSTSFRGVLQPFCSGRLSTRDFAPCRAKAAYSLVFLHGIRDWKFRPGVLTCTVIGR